MSLVQAVITEKFVLVGADTRVIRPDNTISDNSNKLIKLNEQVIWGCTGGTMDNYTFFKGFCNYSEEFGFFKTDMDIDITYTEFIDILSKRFIRMKEIHDDNANHIKYSIMDIVCGYNGHEFEVTLFSLTPEEENEDGVFVVKRSKNFPYKCISAGRIEHRNEFERIANKYHNTTTCDFTAILTYKNILKDVFDHGIKIDPEINNNLVFERMRLKDVIRK